MERRLCEPGGNQSAHPKLCPKDIIVQCEGSGFCNECKWEGSLFGRVLLDLTWVQKRPFQLLWETRSCIAVGLKVWSLDQQQQRTWALVTDANSQTCSKNSGVDPEVCALIRPQRTLTHNQVENPWCLGESHRRKTPWEGLQPSRQGQRSLS